MATPPCRVRAQAGPGIAFGSMSVLVSAPTVLLTPAGPGRVLVISNTLNTTCQLIIDGLLGPELVPGAPFIINMASGGLFIDAGQVISGYCLAAPASGRIQITLL